METLVKADIFFFITSIAVVLLTVGFIIALYYVVRILRNIRDVTGRVDEGTRALSEDLTVLRANLKAGGFAWRHIFGFLDKHSRWFSAKTRNRRGTMQSASAQGSGRVGHATGTQRDNSPSYRTTAGQDAEH